MFICHVCCSNNIDKTFVHTSQNGQLFFQHVGSMQLPLSGNDDKEKHSCV